MEEKRGYLPDEQIIYGIEEAVKEAGLLLKKGAESARVYEKGSAGDVVTDVDFTVQALLKERLPGMLPGSGFIGEEKDGRIETENGCLFIVDPLDGTMNFTRDMRMSAVSVALYRETIPLAGFVYDPFRECLYKAVRGRGAFCNGSPIRVSERPASRAIIQIGCAAHGGRDAVRRSLHLQEKLLDRVMNVRNYGSASLEICNVAAGRMEGYISLSLQPWDHAAAGLILAEAGGTICAPSGKELLLHGPESVIACTPTVRELLLKTFCDSAF